MEITMTDKDFEIIRKAKENSEKKLDEDILSLLDSIHEIKELSSRYVNEFDGIDEVFPQF